MLLLFTEKEPSLLFLHEKAFPVRYFLLHIFQESFFKLCFATIIWQVDDRTDFVQEEPLDLQCLPKI